MENCGHYALIGGNVTGVTFSNVSADTNTTDNSSNGLICLYCKPGYKPIGEGKVKSCVEIDGCDLVNSTMINGCNKCLPNYYNEYNPGGNIY